MGETRGMTARPDTVDQGLDAFNRLRTAEAAFAECLGAPGFV